MADHNLLIAKLSQDASPIRRPWASNRRVVAWLLMALPCGWLSSLVFQRVATDWTQSGAILAAFQLILAFVMGTLAIRNAFLLSIAGRKLLGWKGFAPLIALWLGGVVLSLGRTHIQAHHPDEVNCYLFMMAVSTNGRDCDRVFTQNADVVSVAYVSYRWSGGVLYGADVTVILPSGGGTSIGFSAACGGGVTIVAATMAIGWRWVRVR
jgi:hypothetical protein